MARFDFFNEVTQSMKKIIFILPALMLFGGLNAQNMKFRTDDYAKEWKEIISLEEQGLPKSALQKVEALLAKSKKDENPSQLIKCLIHRSKYISEMEEEGLVKAVNDLRNDMEKATFPTKQILQSMLAEMYGGYLDNNIWKFRNRTTTPNFKTDDIRTWTIQQLADEAALLYRLSLNDDRSKSVAINNFNAITTEGSDERRPVLFDFLAHRAIDYFMDEKSYLTKPNYAFELTDYALFSDIQKFNSLPLESRDSSSLKLWTLKLLQEVTRFHASDENPTALIDADLKRLDFVHDNAVMSNKDDLYLKSLESLRTQYSNNPSFVEISLKIAQFYRNKGSNWKPNPENIGKLDNKKALDIAKEAVQKYPKAYGSAGCRALIDAIVTPSVDFRVEEVNIPNKSILASVGFKNLDSIHYKIIRLYERTNRRDFENEQDRLKYYNGLPFVKRSHVKLPNDGDYNTHTTEIKIDKLPLGLYLILASDNEKYSLKDGGKVSYAMFHVSNLAYWHRSSADEPNEFVVLDRTTGAPLMGVSVEFWENKYNARTRTEEKVKVNNAVSDKNGFVYTRLPKDKYFTTKFIYGKDSLATGDGFSNYFYKQENRLVTETQFFLDRAIYRPGQTVYFKGLVYSYNTMGDRKPTIKPNEPVEVTFYDANGQKVSSLKLTTNSFGTLNGFFTTPSTGRLGNMTIRSSAGGQTYFKVEEYKRPKFEVKMLPLEGDFTLNQDVKAKGQAKAFAGSNIDGAKVKYRVVREVRFPYWRWWGWNPWESAGQEITHGETVTDAKGEFEVKFNALPNLAIPKDKKPVFDYKIYADVTDINGETHSTKSSVSIGYISLDLNLDAPAELNRLKPEPIKITTNNLNGQPLSTKGTVKIELLASPRRPYLNRYWAVPDTHIIAEETFRRDFPLIPYREEDKVDNWAIKKVVSETSFSTPAAPSVNAGTDTNFVHAQDIRKYEPGVYRFTITTTDATGEKIEIIKHILVYDTNDDIVPANKTFFSWLDRESYEPHQTATLHYGTSAERLNVLVEEEVNGKIIERSWHPIEGMVEYPVKLKEEYRGNIFLHISYVMDNRSTLQTKTVIIPYSNKNLNFEYQTFRDKLEPSSEEEWRIKISGKDKEKALAEMAATMYDASLDQFVSNHWSLGLYPSRYSIYQYNAPTFGEAHSNAFYSPTEGIEPDEEVKNYRSLNWFGFNFFEGSPRIVMRSTAMMDSAPVLKMAKPEGGAPPPPPAEAQNYKMIAADVDKAYDLKNDSDPFGETKGQATATQKSNQDLSTVKVRTNLNETVFFFPELMTDMEGNVILKFKMNEALTKWKLLTMAHTTDLKIGFSEKTVVTQKDLMVFPNAPRFLREDDSIEFTAKVTNMTANILRGSAKLELLDALTMKPIDDVLGNTNATLNFEAKAGESTPLAWRLKIPVGKVQAVTYRVVAKADNFSDGEENTLPVLTNRLLVTETLPLSVRGGETKKFTLESLKNASSKTLSHNRLTLEFTQNPAWYAVQALPYLMEYPYDCTEQIFSRYYANSLASSVANSQPKIKAVFDRWRTAEPQALLSNLSKNQELKNALLEETPWVLQAQNEETQKKNIGLLFDLNRMANESAIALKKMQERQLGNGGYAWFPGGRDNWYITQYITEGFGHLDKLGVKSLNDDLKTKEMVAKAVRYCDERIVEYYQELEKEAAKGRLKMDDDNLSSLALHYLYTRSFFQSQKVENSKVLEYFLKQGEKYWLKRSRYEQGLLALALLRYSNGDFGKFTAPEKIVASLKEKAIQSDEMGMYWKAASGFYWYELPIETQALMIELFSEVKDDKSVDALKVWLLKNKQTNAWKTTKATASAVYALLKSGDNWLADDSDIAITVGGDKLDVSKLDKEAGTGYFKTTFKTEDINSKMGTVEVNNPNKVVAWGAMYWQYFENLDKIKGFEATPLKMTKQLFKEENSDKGLIMKPLSDKTPLSTGDKIKVRIELRVDRDMEFVHMKDMRASGFEPINVLSQYKWQDGLGYYESTRDAATNFFFDYLPKGTYVFEYPLVVNHRGDMSNGVTTIQCMYAPEFTSHSEGIRVQVK
ncbi:MAG: alpha-2-macroglobulin [Saprospiraceae bacterium]|nr:alpha-2-macroglobulin [Saprospiraceae bacterium]